MPEGLISVITTDDRVTFTAEFKGADTALAKRLDGNEGANILNGGEGNHVLNGGAGSDTVIRGSGIGLPDGDLGADSLGSGAGTDRFCD